MNKNVFVLFPSYRAPSAWISQIKNILKGLIPIMNSGNHVCISNVVNVSSDIQYGNY